MVLAGWWLLDGGCWMVVLDGGAGWWCWLVVKVVWRRGGIPSNPPAAILRQLLRLSSRILRFACKL